LNKDTAQGKECVKDETSAKDPSVKDQSVKESVKESTAKDEKSMQDKSKATSQPKDQPPMGSFERLPFPQMLSHYNHQATLPPSIELAQSFLMTANMKQAAAQVSTPYFFQSDYVSDTMRLTDSIGNVTKLLSNLGPTDKSTNFIIEQRGLLRAQAQEEKEVRQMIDDKIVDGMEYVRVKE
jgi:hypothetical protein